LAYIYLYEYNPTRTENITLKRESEHGDSYGTSLARRKYVLRSMTSS
jgi:hypothetical protein